MNKFCYKLNQKKYINNSNWKNFLINDIFDIPKIKKYSKIPKSSNEFNIAFISSQSTNNGVAAQCNYKPSYKNAISVSTNGNNFDCFYHDYEFVPSTDVEILFNNNLNKYNSLFICAILNKESDKYNFGKKAKNGAVGKTIIKLPIDDKGNPDWKYMEEYIKKKKRNIIKVLEKLEPLNWNKFSNDKLKVFKVGQLFDIRRGKRIVRSEYSNVLNHIYKYPVITSTTSNNSIDGYYSKFNCEGNVICSGGEAAGMFSTYQENKCWVMDRSRILKPKFDLNKNIALFIIAQLNKYMSHFSYEKSANPSDIEKLLIKLPIDDKGNPDWKYIEEYIKKKKEDYILKFNIFK